MLPRQGFIGTVLMVLGLTGFGLTILAPRLPAAVLAPVSAALERLTAVVAGSTGPAMTARPARTAEQMQTAPTRLAIPSIGVDTPVSLAPLVEHSGVSTWDVPKFVAGHAEGSAGAGQPGNVIVMGHVTSLTLGNVFEHLDQVAVGDVVEIFSFERQFDYRVTDAREVARTDVAVLEGTTDPTLTLITCSGLWLPTVWDYNQRFVVRAELRQTPTTND